jgi:hypothetical protein
MQMNLELAKEIIGNIFKGQGYIGFEKEAWEFICKQLEAVKASHNSASAEICSNDICDYCGQSCAPENGICGPDYPDFKGRKLRTS